jgi:hypothetical protein
VALFSGSLPVKGLWEPGKEIDGVEVGDDVCPMSLVDGKNSTRAAAIGDKNLARN